jgi:REP element-mobilizing transposase RayT
MDVRKFHRRSIRLKGYDYTSPGAYFVTLVTKDRQCLFGEVQVEEMYLNPFGVLVDNEWCRLGERFDKIVVDEWIVMPNHLHGILLIVNDMNLDKESDHPNVQSGQRSSSKEDTLLPGSMGAIVGAYKSTTTRLINGLKCCPGAKIWQRNYYEHIIRNEGEWEAIRKYIRNNPAEWELDRENPNRGRAKE